MQGLMMDRALVIPAIIDHAAQYHGDTEVVSVNTLGGQHRTNYAQIRARALRMASALEKRGMRKSDRIATIAWNNYRHLELYYAISGSGYVLHTINPRLFAEQLVYIINHAEDRILFFDATFLPLVEPLRAHLPQVELFVLMEAPDAATAQKYPWLTFYEDLLAEGENGHRWPATLDERDASSLCYTSGTTGNPKGVLYSHRSTLLHAMMSTTPDVMNFSARDCLLPVVPMFHVNAWGTAYAAPMVGAKLVLPGPGLDGKSLVTLFNTEKVTISAGVPTIWGGLIAYLDASGETVPHLARTIVGGSACPPSIIEKFREKYDVEVIHAWGMTELSRSARSTTSRTSTATCRWRSRTSCASTRAARPSALSSASSTTTTSACPRTASRRAISIAAASGCCRNISRARAAIRSAPKAGSPPAMSRPSIPTAT